MFAYPLVQHINSFRSVDCAAGLLQKFYDQRFTCTRTKAEAIVTSVIAPYAMELLKEDMTTATLISVAADTSHHKAVKLIPIVIRYFNLRGVKDKILDFMSDVEHATHLGSSRTRWLSLKPAVERVLKLNPALQSYFSLRKSSYNLLNF
ncbi:hypothetical protein WMY93_017992 [Mugilogobius chulae]|uniref:Uncharacterized protein n=1 Tax=Mugilogobius chulae TaxID=88201 RepID=A0AAW0NKB2_9GOBI